MATTTTTTTTAAPVTYCLGVAAYGVQPTATLQAAAPKQGKAWRTGAIKATNTRAGSMAALQGLGTFTQAQALAAFKATIPAGASATPASRLRAWLGNGYMVPATNANVAAAKAAAKAATATA